MIDIPAEHERNVCGQFDTYLKKIERTLHVTMIARDGEIKIIGPEKTIGQAKSVFNNLIELSKRGNTITEQNVDYALSLSFTENDGQILEIDKDIICRTISGKPVKPKTLGQKHYVDAIRKKMIVFGIGPAGTGKTYLAMAMAIQAFKNGEVGRIILTRPAIEAGEKLGFLPGDLQSKIDLPLEMTNLTENLVATGFRTVRFKGVEIEILRNTPKVTDNGWIGPDHPNTATVEWGQEMVQTTADYILDLIEELKKVSL